VIGIVPGPSKVSSKGLDPSVLLPPAGYPCATTA